MTEAEQHLLFLRTDEGHVVATIEVMRGVDEAEILNIETLASHRRQGLAQSLLAETFDWARKNQRKAVWLEVRTSNHAAIHLYRKTGFIQAGVRKRYYADGEDALVMKYNV
jgi:[ribosomal protein S18]-alanine N-acetyltransferase